jgi:hypothetical protein
MGKAGSAGCGKGVGGDVEPPGWGDDSGEALDDMGLEVVVCGEGLRDAASEGEGVGAVEGEGGAEGSGEGDPGGVV